MTARPTVDDANLPRISGKHGPTPEHLSFKVLKDQPENDLKAGDTIHASPTKGFRGKGLYYVRGKDENGNAVLHFCGAQDPLTKKGTPRKRLMVGNEHIPEGSKWRDVHRVDWVLMPAGSRMP